MSVDLDPPELGFRRPFTHEVTQVLRLRNPHNDPVAFKVKTTAPKQYCVRPNSGRIEPGTQVEVQVLLQAMKEDPPPDARCRDKFLVQSVEITPDREMANVTAIVRGPITLNAGPKDIPNNIKWQNIEKISKHSIQERKIRVSFLPAQEGTPQHNNVNGTHAHDDAPPAYGSPSTTFGSPAPESSTPQSNLGAKSFPSDRKSDNNNGGAGASSSGGPISALGAAASSVASAVPTSKEDVQRQLDAANAQIAKLKSAADEQGLRLRKSDAVGHDARERITTGTTGMGVQTQPADGVPVQIVAALCLLSFLLAYFFF
ncbi:phosphatidylinositol-binding protein scs2 [Bachmanniomyces sp. S44760]|nr:phosphatidylinositol-binding protein scs2 [Bachmanniomyces sp. S44760]